MDSNVGFEKTQYGKTENDGISERLQCVCDFRAHFWCPSFWRQKHQRFLSIFDDFRGFSAIWNHEKNLRWTIKGS